MPNISLSNMKTQESIQDEVSETYEKIPIKDDVGGGYLFSRLLKCPDCGKSIVRKVSKGPKNGNPYVYYICNSYKNYKTCTKHSLRHDLLEEAVLISIQKHIDVLMDMDKVIKKFDNLPNAREQLLDYKKSMKEKDDEFKTVQHYKRSLYESLKDEIITIQEYKDIKKEYEEQEVVLKTSIKNIQNEIQKIQKESSKDDPCMDHLKKYKNIKYLTRELLSELIQVIYIYEDKRIKIQFNFVDEYKILAKNLEEYIRHFEI